MTDEDKKAIDYLVRIIDGLMRFSNDSTEVDHYLSKPKQIDPHNFIVSALMNLPDHLRLTFRTLVSQGQGTASSLAIETHRVRAVESNYLNQLKALGYLKRERRGRSVYFSINPKEEVE